MIKLNITCFFLPFNIWLREHFKLHTWFIHIIVLLDRPVLEYVRRWHVLWEKKKDGEKRTPSAEEPECRVLIVNAI